MRKRDTTCRPVSVRPSVRPSRWRIVSKRLMTSLSATEPHYSSSAWWGGSCVAPSHIAKVRRAFVNVDEFLVFFYATVTTSIRRPFDGHYTVYQSQGDITQLWPLFYLPLVINLFMPQCSSPYTGRPTVVNGSSSGRNVVVLQMNGSRTAVKSPSGCSCNRRSLVLFGLVL